MTEQQADLQRYYLALVERDTHILRLHDDLARLRAEVTCLKDALHCDQTGLAAALVAIQQLAASRMWILDGRGSYAWDDDRYRREAGKALRGIIDRANAALRDSGNLAHGADGCRRRAGMAPVAAEQQHVTVETARALAAAGLRREQWQIGDWYCWEPPYAFRPEQVVVRDPKVALWFTGRVKGGLPGPLWLPTGQQLLEDLAAREQLVLVTRGGWQAISEWEGHDTTWLVEYADNTADNKPWPRAVHASLAEAAAQAWLGGVGAPLTKGEES